MQNDTPSQETPIDLIQNDDKAIDTEVQEVTKIPEEFSAIMEQIISVSWQGPLPPPHILMQYGEVYEDLPKK